MTRFRIVIEGRSSSPLFDGSTGSNIADAIRVVLRKAGCTMSGISVSDLDAELLGACGPRGPLKFPARIETQSAVAPIAPTNEVTSNPIPVTT